MFKFLESYKPSASQDVRRDLNDPEIRSSCAAVLSVLCDWLEEGRSHEFQIVTASKTFSPLISRDLLIFLEQLPDGILASINPQVSGFFFDFYEQGFDLRIECRKIDNDVALSCIQNFRTSPTKIADDQVIPASAFHENLQELARDFVAICIGAYPELNELSVFASWKQILTNCDTTR